MNFNKVKEKILLKLKGFFSVKFKTFIKKFRSFNAYKNLDKKMLNYINYPNGFYIECGANDGVNQSNTWYYEKKLNWHGILIEPVKKTFLELKKNRNKKNFFYNGALVWNNRKKNLLMTNLKDTLVNRIIKKKNNEKYTKVKAETLTNILKKKKAPKTIDFFSLDVEGFELDVLKGINFREFNFKFILIETENFKETKKILEKFDYKFKKKLSDGDYLFQNKIFN